MNTPERLPSVCPHDCPSACALEVERIDAHTIGRVHGAAGNSYTQGVICAKVARYAERVHHPERLMQPLRRTGPKGSGRFEPVDWDLALEIVAGRFDEIAKQYGSESIWPYYYGGTMGQLQRDGINRLRHVMGYSKQEKTICVATGYAGWQAGTGADWGSDPREILESDLILIWGCNAVATQINLMTLVSQARKRRGAKLVVIDPDRTVTAQKADLHLQPRPGTDGALACAVMQQLFARGLADRDYLQQNTDHPDAFEAHLQRRTPAWAEAICGVPAEQIEDLARCYGETKRSYIRLGLGFSRSRNGAHNVHAVSCLPAITGAWKYPGGGAMLGNSGIFNLDKTLIEGLDAVRPGVRTLDMSRIGAVLNGNPDDLKGGVPVRGMLIQNTNPAAVAPDQIAVRQGLQREDLFLCVHEQFMTETALMADIVLPACSMVETTDIYLTYGQVHLQVARPVIDPPGECRSNHQVICSLAQRLGARHPGFEMNEAEIVDRTLKQSGYPGLAEMTRERWLDCSKPFDEAHFIGGFNWPDGRFRFAPNWADFGERGSGMPRFPDHWEVIEAADEMHPFRLITPPAQTFLNTSFSETAGSRKREVAPCLRIHPADAGPLGLLDGGRVCVGNRRGEIELAAKVSDRLPRGVVAIDGVWPGTAFAGGQGVNSLVGADAAAPAGGAVFHDCAVWIKAVELNQHGRLKS